jgi:hypothetical protein
MIHYCNCGQKYVTESSAKRCCTTQSIKIKKEAVPTAKRGLKKTKEEIKVYREIYYLKNRDKILMVQRNYDQNKRDEKNLQRIRE